MNILLAFAGAVGSCAGVWLAMRRFLPAAQRPALRWGALAAAALLGALGGYAILQKVGFWLDAVRLVVTLALLASAAWCDLSSRRIPNFFPLALLGVYAVGIVGNLLAFGREGWALAGGGLLSGGIVFGLLMLCRLFSHGGIGYGDIKLLTALAMVLGLYGSINTLFLAQLSALLLALALMLAHKLRLKDTMPFAPFIYAGFALSLWVAIL